MSDLIFRVTYQDPESGREDSNDYETKEEAEMIREELEDAGWVEVKITLIRT